MIHVLRRCLPRLLVPLLCAAATLAAEERPGIPIRVQKITENVFCATGPGPVPAGTNSVIIVTSEGVVVVDSGQTGDAGRALLETVKSLTAQPVRYLINTHFHFDHTFGNEAFPKEVAILAQAQTTARLKADPLREVSFVDYEAGLRKRIQRLKETLAAETDPTKTADLRKRISDAEALDTALLQSKPRTPTKSVGERMTLTLGGTEIRLLWLGRAHTDGDLVVFLPKERIICTGDFFNGSIGNLRDAQVDEWPDSLDELARLEFDTVIPSHGAPFLGRDRIPVVRDALRELWNQAAVLERKGIVYEEAAKRIDLTRFAEQLPQFRNKGAPAAAVARVYELLAAERRPSATPDPERLRPPVIPAWAFGHWIWEDDVHSRDAVEYLVGGYRSYGIPVGAVLFDSPWANAYNDFTWNEASYPRPKEMIDDLHARGIKAVLFYTGAINRESTDSPKQKCDSYDFVLERKFAVNGGKESSWWKGPCLHVDFTNPEATAWWRTQVGALHAMGVDGAKIDSAHAAMAKTFETSKGPMSVREFGYHYFSHEFDFHKARNPEFVAMTYAWSGMGLLGWPATSHINWVGDFQGDWTGMRDQLRRLYRSAQEGFSGLACEIGGYWRVPSTTEQFIRYAQLSCFMPIMVNGGQLGALEHHLPWRHDAATLALYREFVLLHYDLAPYLFSAGVDAHLERSTIVRDASVANGSHRLGSSLFVKTITSEDANVRLTLPDDGEWIDFWTGARHPGGSEVTRAYPRDQYPVFVRAGTILPIAGRSRHFGADPKLAPATTFAIYPGAVSETVFHEPLGTGTQYRDVRVSVDAGGKTIRVEAAAEQAFRFQLSTDQAPSSVKGADSWTYDPSTRLLRIEKRGRLFTLNIGGS